MPTIIMSNEISDKALFSQIKNGNTLAFKTIFNRYYQNLCIFASQILKNNNQAEEIVQDLFVKMWEKKETLNITTSVKNYLYRSVRNSCYNFIGHNKIKLRFQQKVTENAKFHSIPDNNYIEIGLFEKIDEAINSLPEKRKEIFLLSREEGLKYREIAEQLNISIKTVETQMGLAIKHLRQKLKHYSFIFISIFIRF